MCNQPLDVYALESFLTFKLFNEKEEEQNKKEMQVKKRRRKTQKNYCYY